MQIVIIGLHSEKNLFIDGTYTKIHLSRNTQTSRQSALVTKAGVVDIGTRADLGYKHKQLWVINIHYYNVNYIHTTD